MANSKKTLDENGVLYLWGKVKTYVATAIANIKLPSKTSDLTNDSGFITAKDVPEGAAASSTVPKMDGTAAAGTETTFARGDHVHPSDTTKVDKVEGKGLSANDYTNEEKAKLGGVEANANNYTLPDASASVKGGVTVGTNVDVSGGKISVKNGTSTTPFPEKYRVMFEGIPCWPKLPNLFKPLKEHGVNVTAVVYAPAFGFVYNGLDEMARAYYKAPNSVCIEQGVDWREGICRDNKVDGVLVHYNRSCKPWSGYMAEMQRRFTKDLGVPCAGFDGDQADPRNFNEAQYETRVQGLVEAMEANKAAKEAAEK